LRAADELGSVRGHLLAEGVLAGKVVRAVRVPVEIGQPAVAVVADQVPGQFGHAGPVVPADVQRGRGGRARQGHHRHLAAEPFHLGQVQHPVVQDQPVALAGQAEDPAGVLAVQPDRADQQVEVPPLGGHLDAPVDQVGELQAGLLVLEDAVRGHRDRGAPDHHPDDLLEPGAQGAGRAIGNEPEFGDRPLDPFLGVRQRVAAAVEHAGHRGDGHARGARDVVDGGGPSTAIHGALLGLSAGPSHRPNRRWLRHVPDHCHLR